MSYDEEVILCLNRVPSKEEFLSLMAVNKNSLAEQLIAPVYYQIFVHSVDIKDEYIKYYSVEYPLLSDYLEMYHDITLSEEELDKNHILKYKNRYQLTDPAYNKDYLDRITGLIKKMEETNED